MVPPFLTAEKYLPTNTTFRFHSCNGNYVAGFAVLQFCSYEFCRKILCNTGIWISHVTKRAVWKMVSNPLVQNVTQLSINDIAESMNIVISNHSRQLIHCSPKIRNFIQLTVYWSFNRAHSLADMDRYVFFRSARGMPVFVSPSAVAR